MLARYTNNTREITRQKLADHDNRLDPQYLKVKQ